MKTALHQEITFNAARHAVFNAYLNARSHTEFTGADCTIEPTEGSAFSAHSGKIVGRNIEIVPHRMIVQAWRPADWPQGVYSLVRLSFEDLGEKCKMTLDHWGCPVEAVDHLDVGWHKMYWEPMATWLKGQQDNP